MRLLTQAETQLWCAERGVREAASARLVYEEWGGHLALLRPAEPSRRVALAQALLTIDAADEDRNAFAGCLVRITDMDIWSPTLDQVGRRLVKALLPAGYEEAELPTCLLSGDEFTEAHALVSIPLLFEWDACIVPETGGCAVFVSHDGPIEVAADSKERFETIFERLRLGGWKVQPKLTRL